MPCRVSKQRFNAFRKYYDPDIFAVTAKRIRKMARNADRLSIEQILSVTFYICGEKRLKSPQICGANLDFSPQRDRFAV